MFIVMLLQLTQNPKIAFHASAREVNLNVYINDDSLNDNRVQRSFDRWIYYIISYNHKKINNLNLNKHYFNTHNIQKGKGKRNKGKERNKLIDDREWKERRKNFIINNEAFSVKFTLFYISSVYDYMLVMTESVGGTKKK